VSTKAIAIAVSIALMGCAAPSPPVPEQVLASAKPVVEQSLVAPPLPSGPAGMPIESASQATQPTGIQRGTLTLKGTPANFAVQQATAWRTNRRARPVLGDNGKLIYTFGESMPQIVCAPLRVCDVELEPGEVVNNLDVGDQIRWRLSPAISGEGKDRRVHVIIKTTDTGLRTNAVINTNRRTYYLDLVARETDFLPAIQFYYPENERRQWEAARSQAAAVVSDLPTLTVDSLNFAYQIEGNARWKPLRVFDDGSKVYIQMPDSVRHNEAPALVLLDKEGQAQLVNYRSNSHYYIVDKLFTSAALIIGVGSAQERVTITRGAQSHSPALSAWSRGDR
jgi:type IV secretion system protein VirB9